MTIGERIRELRVLAAGLTQCQLAQRLADVGWAAKVPSIACRISRWESGAMKPRHENLVRLAAAFRMPVAEFLRGTE